MLQRMPCVILLSLLLISGAYASESASSHVRRAHEDIRAKLDLSDRQEFDDANRGFVAALPNNGVIVTADGRKTWNMEDFSFLEGEAPDTANPSLWRQSMLCKIGGLFEVVPDGIYQVRNIDLSNLTIYEGVDGIVIADPLISAENARAALELYYAHRPKKPVKAVIFSHSHIDHYGGVNGVIAPEFTNGEKPRIIAPDGFLEAAVSENVLAGNIMNRRAIFMYGRTLPKSPKGNIGSGLGLATSSGSTGMAVPDITITKTGQKLTLAGLEFEFLLAPDTEAPAEMHWYMPQFKAITAAENCCHTLHNTYTLRGAKTRDPLSWSKYLDKTLRLWGNKSEVMYGMHHWPVWGNDRVKKYLTFGRDGYRYINDQTLRLANQGYTPDAIAELLAFPAELDKHWAMRGYYGTISHNVKATYSLYLGWYDGNPANLHTLPRKIAAQKYVEYMGGAQALLKNAHKAHANGEYRWVAEIMNHLVMAEPENGDAKALLADAFRQMGYMAESGPWRNVFLSGAQELVVGPPNIPMPPIVGRETMLAMTMEMIFDYLGIHVDPSVMNKNFTADFYFSGQDGTWRVEISNSVLSAWEENKTTEQGDAACYLDKEQLIDLILGTVTLDEAIIGGKVTVSGDRKAIESIIGLGKPFPFWFDLVAH